MARHPYDPRLDPPAPVVPLRVGAPGAAPSVAVMALVDSEADLTVLPVPVVQGARLPPVGEVRVRGPLGERGRATVHAALVELEGQQDLVEVLALGDEALVGRNLLARWVACLYGREGILELRRP
ncbi:MAG TPA: hypothetical protein VNO34_08970 [Actinomycetota bacterium]|nr:hypothetical protein [Actinomycetota bacterium]